MWSPSECKVLWGCIGHTPRNLVLSAPPLKTGFRRVSALLPSAVNICHSGCLGPCLATKALCDSDKNGVPFPLGFQMCGGPEEQGVGEGCQGAQPWHDE